MTTTSVPFRRKILGCISALAILAGCASTEEIMRDDPDPFEKYNRFMFQVNDGFDKAVFKPIAKGYRAIMPKPINDGVTNFFGNINDVITIVNDILQFKIKQGWMDTTRVVYNTTFGLAGFFDVATYMGLPKHNEDFGQTLGYWGIGEGYYLVLPFLGPNTTRDVWGLAGNVFIDPLSGFTDSAAAYIASRTAYFVDLRADLLQVEERFEEMQIEPYSFQRQTYLQRRRNLVYDGNPPRLKPDFDAQ
jgi:phospholipid-binding lipoprotein MlaA